MKKILLPILLLIYTCDSDSPTAPSPILGCMDETACNFDDTSDVDDGSCYSCFKNDCEQYAEESYD